MQERKKLKIVIASVLNTVDDSRMYEKLGQTLASQHEVHIVGIASSKEFDEQAEGMTFHSITTYNRLSWRRLTAGIRQIALWLRIRPHVLLISTHELLIPAVLYGMIYRSEIFYDVRENYYLNILSTDAFPRVFRRLIAWYVRAKEVCTAPFVSHFLLAEKTYEKELPFTSKRSLVLENTYNAAEGQVRNKQTGYSKLLFTGTLDDSTGVFEVIEFAKDLHDYDPTIELTIAGYAHRPEVLARIIHLSLLHPFIRIIGLFHYLPHSVIVEEIQKADYGVIWYPPSKHTEHRVPTKFFEYSSLGLAILAPDFQSFAKRITDHGLGICFSTTCHETILLREMKDFQRPDAASPAFTWKSQGASLLRLFESL